MTPDVERPLGAQISHMLRDRGVKVIFGIPGVHNQELYRGVEEAGITHVLARHEQGAGFMADGYARASQEPGIAFVITGPGLCNIMTPLGQAYSDSVPVLVIASCLDDTADQRGQLHQMKDQEGAARAVCDWSETARTPQAAYNLIDRALIEFETRRPRPKAVHIPISALQAQAASATPARQPKDANGYEDPPHRDVITPFVSPTSLTPVVERLLSAERPIFIIGGGLAHEGVKSALTRMLERFGAGVFTTYAARGLADTAYPLFFGSTLARPEAREMLNSSDCVIVLGSDLAEVDHWRTDIGIGPGAGVHINTDAEILAQAHPLDTTIDCDAMNFLFASVLTGAAERAAPSRLTEAEVQKFRSRARAGVDAEFPGVLPVMDALQSAMPGDAMIFSDMTQFAYAANEVWDMPKPRHWHHPSGFGTLGYALPAAIGGALAREGLPTCCIIGDYGLQYTLPELATAVELRLPLPIILWDNGKLGAIEDSMIAAQIAPNAVIQRNPDFLALARAYGARAVQPDCLDEIAPALEAAFAADGPTVIRLTPDLTS